MKHFALIAFATLCYWLVSNPYNWPVLTQTVTVAFDGLMVSNVGESRKESAERLLARSQLELLLLKDKRDSVK